MALEAKSHFYFYFCKTYFVCFHTLSYIKISQIQSPGSLWFHRLIFITLVTRGFSVET